jgi:hypothetical protein
VTPDGVTLFDVEDLSQWDVFVNHVHRFKAKNRVLMSGSFGTSFDQEAGIYEYRLGGFGRLGAFNNQQVSGDNFILGSALLLREWFRLPDVLGQRVYYGGGVEVGSAFDTWDDADWDTQMTLGVIMETLLGPAFIGGSVSFDTGDTRLYVSLAPLSIR